MEQLELPLKLVPTRPAPKSEKPSKELDSIHLAVGKLTGKVFVGRINKRKTEFSSKKDVTSEFIAAMIEFVGVGNEIGITRNDGTKYLISVSKAEEVPEQEQSLPLE